MSEICERLDGMPLAIELAAARIAVLTPAEILDRMGDRFRLLSGGRGRERRRTLQATLDWSYDLLDTDEQDFFRSCGAFVGSFDLAAAVAVGGFDDYEAMDLLESLVSKSLVALDDTRGASDLTRYRLLETVRIYAGDHLARTETVVETRDRHLDYYRSLVETSDWVQSHDIDRAAGFEPDWPNISSALEWTTSNSDWKTAAPLAFGCQALWEHNLPSTEGRRWIELILDHLPEDELYNLASLSPGDPGHAARRLRSRSRGAGQPDRQRICAATNVRLGVVRLPARSPKSGSHPGFGRSEPPGHRRAESGSGVPLPDGVGREQLGAL